MSNITLQPVGLFDASKRYWAQRIDTTAMLRFKEVTYNLPPDFTSYITFGGGSQYFPRGTRTYYPPAAATTLFANYKTIIELRLKFEKDVFPTYARLRELFHNYATEAHDHYEQVLNILGTLRASILATNTHSTADLENLRTIVDVRVDLSSRMKENANYLVDSLQGISRSLPACIDNINKSVADLNVFCVFTADEQKKISNPNTINITGFAEKYALVKLMYAPVASVITENSQAVVNEIGPAITEMQEELSRWDNITLDLTSILSLITKEEAATVQILAKLDNAQILQKWQELGDIVIQAENS
ncbi:hypothetical protein sscle_09g070410 [Sclerotinia sclerotiorum 1980 UF-70]|uniref:Uncharacterized protein n=1 Tax=Sclerotinia sclerotiorum (strain ATCC 18683 / 1980 / Ss-1) TaxID=665079 RepID=A0A1D9QBI3_SCLS1|nr:hypothetical protein sscle_09g070410 [Sclerotinia sclerotiorum 1980 UF-70]